jgi:predicted HicB family RNase H-like nuclease
MMAKTETLNLRVSPEFKRKLMDSAAQQKRSVTNYLEAVLTAMWERERTREPDRVPKKGPRT